MLYGKNKKSCQKLLHAFCQNTQTPTFEYRVQKFDKKIVFDMLDKDLQNNPNVWERKDKTLRLSINKELSLTITSTGKGYVAIGHTKKFNYKQQVFAEEQLWRENLEEFGFNTTTLEAPQVWLGSKLFKECGFNDEDIVQSILHTIEELKNREKDNLLGL